jgi:hypothetical protein
MTLHPYTERDAQEKARRDRAMNVSVASIQMGRLEHTFNRTKKVDHTIFQRLIQTLLKIGGHIPMSQERAENLKYKLQGAVTGDGQCTVQVESGRIYVEGYFSLNKLKDGMLW